MARLSTIELHKESMKFSSGHFTIFSATQRERLHGHNYSVHAAITTLIEDQGLNFDYRYYKQKLHELCKELNQGFLLATESKFLRIEFDGDYCYAHFNDEKIPFLKKDVILLPLTNITVEELSLWFVNRLTEDTQTLHKHAIQNITVKVFSTPGQSASSCWSK